jgi:hypothetical protein
MCSTRATLRADVEQELGVTLGDLLVVVDDGNHLEDCLHEGEATNAPPPGAEEHADSQLGNGDRGDRYVVVLSESGVERIS